MAFHILTRARLCVSFLLLSIFLLSTAGEISPGTTPVYEPSNQAVLPPHLPLANPPGPESASHVSSTLEELHAAVSTLQNSFFSLWLGKYTTAIDWTAAVMSTHVSATLSSLSRLHTYTLPGLFASTKPLNLETQRVDNEINRYFAQISAYYFGEDHFAIRMQAFDDMLWVVLGWLESIEFIRSHSAQHYPSSSSPSPYSAAGGWHAQQFIPAFAHRARVFYELAEKGWDWRLCGGGMTWNPRLLPYKNAITNQLYISASASMYLRFPGDRNCEPFITTTPSNNHTNTDDQEDKYEQHDDGCTTSQDSSTPTFDPTYLAAAVHGYTWLNASGMRNAAGLYTDGFHIAGYRTNHSKTICNERNEMLYTYNQGVVLSGLRDLWEATGTTAYLADAHTLIAAVLRATGWATRPRDTHTAGPLGTRGILQDACDAPAKCNQDAQAFKGIFFHHLTRFCAPLPRVPAVRGRTHAADAATAAWHRRACDGVADWVVWNARAALRTRDARGRFGGAWDVPGGVEGEREEGVEGAVDYRNYPARIRELDIDVDGDALSKSTDIPANDDDFVARDANDRGRGRTVETQGSGLAVVRAMSEFMRWRREASHV